MRGFLLFSVIRFRERGCFIVAKLEGEKRASQAEAKPGIFQKYAQFFKSPSTALSPLKSGNYCFVSFLSFMRQARRKEFKLRALRVALLWDIMGRKAYWCTGGGILPRTRSNAFDALRNSFRSVFVYIFDPFSRFRRGRIAFRSRTRTAGRTSYSIWLL